jgi:hypothetical protein
MILGMRRTAGVDGPGRGASAGLRAPEIPIPKTDMRTLDMTTPRISEGPLFDQLVDKYGFRDDVAERILEIARRVGPNAVPVSNGFITITYQGRSLNVPHYRKYIVETHTGNIARKVAHPVRMNYNSSSDVPVPPNRKKGANMATRRTAKAAPVEEPEEVEEAGQFDGHLTKNLSPTMQDYAVWFEDNVAPLDDVDPARLLALGSSLYPHFQKSEFNQERREERKSARSSAVEEPEEEELEEEPAKPARRPARSAAKPEVKASAAKAPARASGRRPRATAAAPY